MSPETIASLADFALKAGVPASLGCVIVWYLLWKLIPRLIDTFERTVALQAQSFKDAMVEHHKITDDLRETLITEGQLNRKHREDEGRQTREALRVLHDKTDKLHDKTDKLHDKTNEIAQLTAISLGPSDDPFGPRPPKARRTAVGG
jgi:hypothetical protein